MPTPENIIFERKKLGLDVETCAEIIKSTPEYWAGCEDGTKKMHYGLWELFFIKVRSPRKYGLKIQTFKNIGKTPEYKFHYIDIGEDWIFHGNDDWQDRVIQAVRSLQHRSVKRFNWLKIKGKDSLVVRRVEDAPIAGRSNPGAIRKYNFHDLRVGESVTYSGTEEEKRKFKTAIRVHTYRTGKIYDIKKTDNGDILITALGEN